MQQNAWHELKHVLVTYGNNIGLNEQTAMQVPADKIADLTLGSKLAYVILLQERGCGRIDADLLTYV